VCAWRSKDTAGLPRKFPPPHGLSAALVQEGRAGQQPSGTHHDAASACRSGRFFALCVPLASDDSTRPSHLAPPALPSRNRSAFVEARRDWPPLAPICSRRRFCAASYLDLHRVIQPPTQKGPRIFCQQIPIRHAPVDDCSPVPVVRHMTITIDVMPWAEAGKGHQAARWRSVSLQVTADDKPGPVPSRADRRRWSH